MIRQVNEQTNEEQIAIQVKLDYPEKDYAKIKVSIDNGEWKELPILNKDENLSDIHVFSNLERMKMYLIHAQCITKDGHVSEKVGRSLLATTPSMDSYRMSGGLR